MPLDRIPGSMLSLLTPSQFDASLQPATTEFVQRALGNRSGHVSITASTALGASHIGKELSLEGAAVTSITLPAGAPLPPGVCIHISAPSVGAAGATINAVAGEFIVTHPGAAASSIVMMQDETATFVNRGGLWTIASGDVKAKYSGTFAKSLATSGYQKLPSGLIVQWGQTAVINTTGTVTFPIAFPSALYSISVCSNNSTAATTTAGTYSRTLTNFILRSARTDLSFDYIAIGS